MARDGGAPWLKHGTGTTDAPENERVKRDERLWWVPLVCWPFFFGATALNDDSIIPVWFSVAMLCLWVGIAAVEMFRRLRRRQ